MKTLACSSIILVAVAACGGSPSSAVETSGSVASDAVRLAWSVTAGEGDLVDVSLAVGSKTMHIGTISGASDDPQPPLATCSTHGDAKTSELHCGGTPEYSYFLARLEGANLVVTRVSGVEGHTERRAEVTRVPVRASSLVTASLLR